MKSSTWKISAAALLPSVATMLFVQACGGSGDANAQAAPDPHVGLWEVVVTQRDCTTSAQIAQFRAILVVNAGGTMSAVNGGGPTALSPFVGTWVRNADNTYTVSARAFRYNADGTPAGANRISATRTMAPDHNSFTATARNEQYDTAGVLLRTLCTTDASTRIS